MKMARQYWIASVLALVSSLAMFGGVWWLDQAVVEPVSVAAAEQPATQTVPTAFEGLEETRQDVDVALAIDFSGSMTETDPEQLRLQAAELLVSSLAADVFPRATEMGYIAFGTEATVEQELVPVEQEGARADLIQKLDLNRFDDFTDIASVLERAYEMLFPEENRRSENIPSLILLTDGEPRAGTGTRGEANTLANITALVERLTNRGTVVFVILLRGCDSESYTCCDPEDPDCDTSKPVWNEPPALLEWRDNWANMALRNERLTYAEAESADELEGIYNTIRARLVNEGAQPGERTTYDPLDTNASIDMPPDLFLAHLLVSKPSSLDALELVSPDGTVFSALAEEDSRNEHFESNLYHRYKIYLPEPGAWTLQTNTTEPIYYLLNPESRFSVRVAWPVGLPYLNPKAITSLPFVIVDEQGDPIDKRFNLRVEILRIDEDETGTLVEQTENLPAPAFNSGNNTYVVQVSPEQIRDEESVLFQIRGSADDGALVNLSSIRIPVVAPPTGALLQLPDSVECLTDSWKLLPPTIDCANAVDAHVRIQGANALSSGTLHGDLYPPGAVEPTGMQEISSDTLQGAVTPLLSIGTYGVAAQVTGEMGEDLIWSEWVEDTIVVTPPAWVEKWRNQLFIGGVLLAVVALWKPVIVWGLLLAFRPLGLAPRGFYAELGENLTSDIYRRAKERRKLFVLTAGVWSRGTSNDITVNEDMPVQLEDYRRGFRRLLPNPDKWTYEKPAGRLIKWPIPFMPMQYESDKGLRTIGRDRPVQVKVHSKTLLVGQSDWTDHL